MSLFGLASRPLPPAAGVLPLVGAWGGRCSCSCTSSLGHWGTLHTRHTTHSAAPAPVWKSRKSEIEERNCQISQQRMSECIDVCSFTQAEVCTEVANKHTHAAQRKSREGSGMSEMTNACPTPATLRGILPSVSHEVKTARLGHLPCATVGLAQWPTL